MWGGKSEEPVWPNHVMHSKSTLIKFDEKCYVSGLESSRAVLEILDDNLSDIAIRGSPSSKSDSLSSKLPRERVRPMSVEVPDRHYGVGRIDDGFSANEIKSSDTSIIPKDNKGLPIKIHEDSGDQGSNIGSDENKK